MTIQAEIISRLEDNGQVEIEVDGKGHTFTTVKEALALIDIVEEGQVVEIW